MSSYIATTRRVIERIWLAAFPVVVLAVVMADLSITKVVDKSTPILH